MKEKTGRAQTSIKPSGSYVGNPGPDAGIKPRAKSDRPIDAGVDIGHVHLRAADLEKIRAFYVGILGFDVMVELPGALFLAAGGYHHTLGFNTWESNGGTPPPPGTTGLYHVAIRYPDRSTGSTITAHMRRSICGIRKRTASSSAGTGRPRSGRETPRDI